MILDLHTSLSLRRWERVLFQHPFTVEEGWSGRLREEGLVVDLSRVEWIEPAALVRAVLLIEGALLDGASVCLRLPRPLSTRAEDQILRLAEASKDKAAREKAKYVSLAIRRRKKALSVLDRLRLRDALKHDHLTEAPGSLDIDERYDWSTPGNGENSVARILEESSESKASSAPWYAAIAYRLQWVAAPRTPEGKSTIDNLAEVNVLADVLTHPSGRVLAADGQTLAYVFLKELVENSIDHSNRQFALVAAWSRPNKVGLKDSEVLNCERPFAKWCKGYPLIEVIVGDSGKGIPATLSSRYDEENRPLSDQLSSQSENDRILAWSFDKWSSRFPPDPERGTRGLYRVQRIVQKYDGCITLRSESSFVGIDSGHSDPPDYIFERKRLARSPGTIVHVRLPVMLSESLPEKRTAQALKQSDFRVLEFYALDWNEESKAVPEVAQRILEACQGVSSGRPTCVVADFGFATLERRTLERLFRKLVQIAHPIAIVVANIKGPSWDSSSETIHSLAEQIVRNSTHISTAEGSGALHVQDAILFQHADGRFAWVGIPENIGRYLISLWEKGKLSATELRGMCPDGEERNGILRQFAEAYHVAARLPDGGLSLKFNKEDIYEQLCKHTEERIHNAVESGGAPAVLRGICRTPSLGIVNRFVNISSLLALIGVDKATGILAQKCSRLDEMREGSVRKIQIIADWKTDRELLSAFKNNLVRTLQYPIKAEINQVTPRDLPVIAEESLVLLFTGVILTGDSAINLLSQAIRAHRLPACVVSILDCRTQPGVHLRALGQSVQTLSLTHINLQATAAQSLEAERSGRLIDINPISHLPERDLETNYQTPSETLEEVISEQDALYFNHIVRPNGRHFCFYLDAFKILGALDTADPTSVSETGKEIISKVRRAVDEWADSKFSIDLICLPNFPRSETPSAAEIIARDLAVSYDARLEAITPTGDLVSLRKPRPSSGRPGQSVHPIEQLTFLDLAKPSLAKNVVIVDWGALTGKNLRDSIRFVAKKGVQRILVVVFLSHLSADDEHFLSKIRRVETHHSGTEDHSCEVTVRFIDRFPLQSYDRLSCPYCRQIGRLNNEQTFFATDLLQRFVELAKLELSPRTLQEVREARDQREGLVDGGTIDPDRRTTEIAKIRRTLDRASERTGARAELRRTMSAVGQAILQGDHEAKAWRSCLIRLLATEWTWLKQEPLSLSVFKGVVADLAQTQILDSTSSEIDRRNSIVVLRTASKERFARHLPELFNLLVTNEQLLAQLLYGVFTYLHRDYLIPQSLNPLVESLAKCAKTVRDQIGITLSGEVGQTVNGLFFLGQYLSDESGSKDMPAAMAWKALRHRWVDEYDVHHPLADSIRGLFLSFFEDDLRDPSKDLPVIDWRGLRDKWDGVERYLLDILVLLAPLAPIFEGLEASGFLSGQEGKYLVGASSQEGLSKVSTLRTQLDMFANFPTAVRNRGAWETFRRERDWLWDVMLKPGTEIQAVRIESSALVRVLSGCPTDLRKALAVLSSDLEGKFNLMPYEFPDSEILVFCHEDILDLCFRELAKNVGKHASPPVGELISVEISVQENNGLTFSLRNNGYPKEASRIGRGLIRCKQALQVFGCSLDGRFVNSVDDAREHDGQHWLYETTLTLPRW